MDNRKRNNLKNRTKKIFKTHGPSWLVDYLRKMRLFLRKIKQTGQTAYGKALKNHINLRINKNKPRRYLEIGPGNERIPGFETLNIVGGANVDYVLDAAKPLPFEDNTFDLIYASHVLEHIPWYKTEEVISEWVRILKPGGQLEVWVPDGLKICKVLIEAEKESITAIPDDWDMLNPRKDPFLWVNGRLIYGARPNYPSWHRALFTPRYLKELFKRVGLIDVREMDCSEVRGHDHGWINLGVKGTNHELP